MHPLLLVFIAVSVVAAGFDLVLSARQAAHVARHRDRVPDAFAGTITLAEHRRAAEYEQVKQRVGRASTVFGLVVAVAWAVFGYDALYGWVAHHVPVGLSRSVLFLLAAGAISSLLGLPFALVRTFGVEQRFGFNRTTPGPFRPRPAEGRAPVAAHRRAAAVRPDVADAAARAVVGLGLARHDPCSCWC